MSSRGQLEQGALADKAFAEYEFGEGVMVTDASGWEYVTSGHERTRKVYVETEQEDDGPAPRWVLNFTVRFDPTTGALSEAYAMDRKGQIWGTMAAKRNSSGDASAGADPLRWAGSSRWAFDRGAMPGEPFAFLDGNRETCIAAMVEVQSPGRPAMYEVRRPGGVLIAQSENAAAAASAAQDAVESQAVVAAMEQGGDANKPAITIKDLAGFRPGEWGTTDGLPSIAWWRHGVAAEGEPSVVRRVQAYACDADRMAAYEAFSSVSQAPVARTVVVSAHSTDDSEDGPQYCAFEVDEAFLARVAGLGDLCATHDLTQANVTLYPRVWGPAGIEEDARLQGGELIVCRSGLFWFSDSPKVSGGYFESRSMTLQQLQEMLANDPGEVVFANEEVRALYEEDHADDQPDRESFGAGT